MIEETDHEALHEIIKEFVLSRRTDIENGIEDLGNLRLVLHHFLTVDLREEEKPIELEEMEEDTEDLIPISAADFRAIRKKERAKRFDNV